MKKQMTKLIAWFIIFMFVIAGCANQQQTQPKPEETKAGVEKSTKAAEYPLTIQDSFEREIVIEKEPNRVISIAPSITEMIFTVGAGEKLVGRTEYCDYPEEATKVDTVGSLSEPNIEKIVELEPDVVIAATHFKEESLEKLEALNIPVVILYDGENFEEVYKAIATVGEIVNHSQEAKNVIAAMEQKLKEVMDKVKDREKPSVYYVVGFGEYGDYTAGGDTFVGKMIEMAGGENVAKEAEDWSYSLEKLVEQDPDILICSQFFDAKAGIEVANGYKDLTAVKEGHLYEIDNNLLDRQGPRLADGLEALARIIHPDAFQ